MRGAERAHLCEGKISSFRAPLGEALRQLECRILVFRGGILGVDSERTKPRLGALDGALRDPGKPSGAGMRKQGREFLTVFDRVLLRRLWCPQRLGMSGGQWTHRNFKPSPIVNA